MTERNQAKQNVTSEEISRGDWQAGESNERIDKKLDSILLKDEKMQIRKNNTKHTFNQVGMTMTNNNFNGTIIRTDDRASCPFERRFRRWRHTALKKKDDYLNTIRRIGEMMLRGDPNDQCNQEQMEPVDAEVYWCQQKSRKKKKIAVGFEADRSGRRIDRLSTVWWRTNCLTCDCRQFAKCKQKTASSSIKGSSAQHNPLRTLKIIVFTTAESDNLQLTSNSWLPFNDGCDRHWQCWPKNKKTNKTASN